MSDTINQTAATLPTFSEIANGAAWLQQQAVNLHGNVTRITADLEATQSDLFKEAAAVREEAETRATSLIGRANQIGVMLAFLRGQDVPNAIGEELPALKRIA